MKLGHFLTPYIRINTKWIKALNVRPETIKNLEESTGSNLFDIGHSNIFLDMSPGGKVTKAKINYWDFIKRKTSVQRRRQSTKLKGNPWNARIYLQMTYLIKG